MLAETVADTDGQTLRILKYKILIAYFLCNICAKIVTIEPRM